MRMNEREIIGWCTYCKAEIFEGDDFVVRHETKYHVKCYELIKSDTFGEDLSDYTETDFE